MKNTRHSDPSLSAKGSKVAAASSVASASRGKGITMKQKKYDLVSGGDGEGVKAALHGSPEEGSWKKIFPTNLGNRLRVTKRSSQHESPSSGEASSPLSRKKKRSKRIHLVPVVKRLSRSLSPPSNADALSRKKNFIKRIAIARVLPKRSSLPEPSNTDGEAQSTGEASASLSRKKKFSKRVLDIASNNSSCLPPRNEALLAEEIATPKQKKSDHSQPVHPASQGGSNAHRAGDVSINKAGSVEPADKIDPPIDLSHALVVDNCLDANPRMDKLIPPPSCGSSRVQSTWTQEKKQAEVYQRLSLYYIEAHELPSPGEEPDDAQLNEELESPLHAYERIFLQRVKDDPEWYFHPEQCKLAGLEHYQRLVLRDDSMYVNWKEYRLNYHTYQGDLEYVQFCKEMAEQIKWIEDEATLFGDQRLRNELEAFIQTLKIAMRYPNISARSVVSALSEHLYSLRFDFDHRKDLDGVYLEIWKWVAKNKVNFGEALRRLYEENIFPFRRREIKSALDSYPGFSWIKYDYDTYVDGIDERFSEDEAHPLIIEAVEKMVGKRKNYLDYTRKKLEIAARIGLKTSSLEVTAQGGENHGEGKAAIVSIYTC